MLTGTLVGVILLVLAAAYGCFRIVFYAVRREADPEIIDIPKGLVYQPYRQEMENWVRRKRLLPQEEFAITSFDGLTLRGRFYEYAPGAPVELLIHGYRGNAERDMSAGIFRSFSVGHSAFLVDQRGSGHSDGNIITFGVNESRDCLKWVDFLVGHFGPDVKIMLSGISMGAATVLMAAGQPLPSNVVGVLADCGFTSAKGIICHVMRTIHLPPKVFYPLVKLGARLFGGFSLEERSPIQAVQQCRLPVIFYHGEDDALIPPHMSKANYEACGANKKLVLIPGAGHGLCLVKDRETYLKQLLCFCEENGIPATDNGLQLL